MTVLTSPFIVYYPKSLWITIRTVYLYSRSLHFLNLCCTYITAHSFCIYYFVFIALVSLTFTKLVKECNHPQPISNTSETVCSNIVTTSYIEHTYINTNGNPEHYIWETLSCLQRAKNIYSDHLQLEEAIILSVCKTLEESSWG